MSGGGLIRVALTNRSLVVGLVLSLVFVGAALISVIWVPQDVTALCLRWAAWLYQKQDAAFGDGADWLFPANVPDDLRALASGLRFVRVA